MGKYTYVGGDYLENIGGNKIVHVVGDNDVHSNKQIIQKADGGIFYEEPKDAPEKKVEEDKQQPITPVTKMALISPSKDYKGEFGIDWCEKDDDFDKIVSFQNTKVTDIEYVFDEATKQFKKATATDDNLKQTLVKQMYLAKSYTDGAKKKEYLTTWMNIAEGITAKINLTTWFIDTAKKADSEKEFITFTPNENFEITYDKVLNENIKIKVKSHKKQYNLEIKAIKTFETDQIISIVDEAGNPVGQIEMMANNQETLEIKIIPVVLKTNEAEQNTKAEEIYNKAIAAINTDKKTLSDTFNMVSLNQAGIKSMFIPNLKGAEKLVVDIAKEYKNYWSSTEKSLRDWEFDPADVDLTKKPTEWKNEDGQILYKNDSQNKRMLLDELEEKFYSKYGKTFKGAIIFVVDEDYFKPNTLGYSQSNALRSQGTIVFKAGITMTDVYVHEVGHMLGLEHIFFKDITDFNGTNSSIQLYKNEIPKYNELIENRNELIAQQNSIIKQRNENIKDYGKNNDGTINEEYVKGEKEIIAESDKKNIEYNNEINKFKNEVNDYDRRINVELGCKFKIKQKTTNNFMDYEISRKFFSKHQSKVMQNEEKDFYLK
ncbi:matrixin family metalloprotease [Flavobacterium psychrophilum]|nr:matrixin family metalloprotease [Flavobacterium psychrophilum]